MAGFRNARELADAQDAGQYLYASWRKQPTQTTGAGIWFDLSMSPGNPAPNYYIGSPNVFTPLKQSTDGGLRHGGNVNVLGKKKFIRKLMAQTVTTTAVPLSCLLLDYVGFYPFIDESILDEQFMDNTTPVPRYVNNEPDFYGPSFLAASAAPSLSQCTRQDLGGGVYKVTLTGVDDPTVQWSPNTGASVRGRTFAFEIDVWTDAGQPTEGRMYTYNNSVSEIVEKTIVYTETPQRLKMVRSFTQSGASNFSVRIDGQNTAPPAGSYFYYSNLTVKELLNPGKYPGLQMMPVVVAGQTGNQFFTVNYTNQDGVKGRITKSALMTTQFVNGTILHSSQANSFGPNNGPFLPLQEGDSGVRSVQSVTIGGVGDVGLFALVLVKPLATFSLFGIDAPTEVDYLQESASMPEILDDAYLNLVCLPNGTLANAPINGILETTFN